MVMCWLAVVGGREVEYSLCIQFDLHAFSKIIILRGKKWISLIRWGWEEKEKGVRAESCWLRHYFTYNKSQTFNQEYLISLCFLFLPGCPWRYVEETAANFSIHFLVPCSFGANCAPRASCLQMSSHGPALVFATAPLAAGLSWFLSHLSTKKGDDILGCHQALLPHLWGRNRLHRSLFRVGEQHQLRMSPLLRLICFKQ